MIDGGSALPAEDHDAAGVWGRAQFQKFAVELEAPMLVGPDKIREETHRDVMNDAVLRHRIGARVGDVARGGFDQLGVRATGDRRRRKRRPAGSHELSRHSAIRGVDQDAHRLGTEWAPDWLSRRVDLE